MKKYSFKGSVSYFGKVVDNCFTAETMAVTPGKAKSNILFQAKKNLNLLPSAGGVTLNGKLTAEEA